MQESICTPYNRAAHLQLRRSNNINTKRDTKKSLVEEFETAI